jgi:hypothetical protein
MTRKELIIIIILVIILGIILLLTNRKENLTCSSNCASIKIEKQNDEENCLSCEYCGICTTKNGDKICVNGTKDKPLFVEDCVSWQFNTASGENTGRKFIGYQNLDMTVSADDYDYDTILRNLGQQTSETRVIQILNQNKKETNNLSQDYYSLLKDTCTNFDIINRKFNLKDTQNNSTSKITQAQTEMSRISRILPTAPAPTTLTTQAPIRLPIPTIPTQSSPTTSTTQAPIRLPIPTIPTQSLPTTSTS